MSKNNFAPLKERLHFNTKLQKRRRVIPLLHVIVSQLSAVSSILIRRIIIVIIVLILIIVFSPYFLLIIIKHNYFQSNFMCIIQRFYNNVQVAENGHGSLLIRFHSNNSIKSKRQPFHFISMLRDR